MSYKVVEMESISTTQMIIMLIVLALIGYCLYYYFSRKSTPSYADNPVLFVTGGRGADTPAYKPLLTQDQVTQYLADNFTISFFLEIDHLSSSPVPNATSTQPIVWIVGVGAVLVNVNTGATSVAMTTYPVDQINAGTQQNVIQVNTATPASFVGKWNQITLTVSGSQACVYLNGKIVNSCMTLSNVVFSAPTGLYFLQGLGPAARVCMIQAWPRVQTPADIQTNYTNNVDSNGSPQYAQAGISMTDLLNSMTDLFCQTGLCPSADTGVVLGPFQQITYEYA